MNARDLFNVIDALHTRVIDEMDEDPEICQVLEDAMEALDDIIHERAAREHANVRRKRFQELIEAGNSVTVSGMIVDRETKKPNGGK